MGEHAWQQVHREQISEFTEGHRGIAKHTYPTLHLFQPHPHCRFPLQFFSGKDGCGVASLLIGGHTTDQSCASCGDMHVVFFAGGTTIATCVSSNAFQFLCWW